MAAPQATFAFHKYRNSQWCLPSRAAEESEFQLDLANSLCPVGNTILMYCVLVLQDMGVFTSLSHRSQGSSLQEVLSQSDGALIQDISLLTRERHATQLPAWLQQGIVSRFSQLPQHDFQFRGMSWAYQGEQGPVATLI